MSIKFTISEQYQCQHGMAAYDITDPTNMQDACYMWPLTRKRTLTAFRFWTESRLQAVYQPFRKKFHPFKRLWSSVQKKLTSVRTAGLIRSKNLLIRSNGLSHPFRKNLHPFERLRSTVQEISWSIWTAWVIRSKQSSLYLFERLESSVGPFRKKTNVIRSFARTAQYLFRENLHRLDGYSHPLEMSELSLKDSAGDSFFSLISDKESTKAPLCK